MSVINKVSQTVRGTHINTVKDKQLDFFFLVLWLAELDLFHIAPDENHCGVFVNSIFDVDVWDAEPKSFANSFEVVCLQHFFLSMIG